MFSLLMVTKKVSDLSMEVTDDTIVALSCECNWEIIDVDSASNHTYPLNRIMLFCCSCRRNIDIEAVAIIHLFKRPFLSTCLWSEGLVAVAGDLIRSSRLCASAAGRRGSEGISK